MANHIERKFSFKIWIEQNGKPLIGKGGAQILEQIRKEHSISKAAKKLGMSYRYVWNYIHKLEKTLDKPIIQTYRGGIKGGGGAELTDFGKELLEEYKHMEKFLENAVAKASK